MSAIEITRGECLRVQGTWTDEAGPINLAGRTLSISEAYPAALTGGTVTVTDAAALHAAVTAATDTGMEVPQGTGLTLADCEALVAGSIIVDLADEGPFETFDRLGLGLVMVSENPE